MITLDKLDLEHKSPGEIGELLIEAKKAYYTGGRPIMDDHTYDTLEDILRKKAPYHRIFTKVGNPNFDTGFDKKKHSMVMGSQNKVNNFPDLVHYFELKKITPLLVKGGEGGGFVVEPKCDGISLEIEYKNGDLVEAITRGDGEVGDVITQNVVHMKNFVSHPALSQVEGFTGSVRCEIVVTKKDFARLNQLVKKNVLPALSREGRSAKADPEGFYSNPRNAASGLSQRLDSKYADFCSLYAVDIFSDSLSLTTELEKIKLLKSLGFTTVEAILCQNFDDINKIYQEFLTKKRESYPFEIDGLVVKLNDLSLSRKLGYKDNRPKFQLAYKFPADSNQTVVKSIVWQVGPLGSVTPVAQVDPIELSGAIITFASLGNYDLVKKMELNLGDVVQISRRGDVIPHIEKVISKVTKGHIDIPQYCPACGTLLTVKEKYLRCPNTAHCLPQIIGSLNVFCQTLDILGLSDKTITKLYQAGRVTRPGDFFKLTVDDIKDLDNLGEKSAKNIINQIQQKKMLSLVEVLDAAVIPNFSAARIQQLIDAGFDTPEKFLNLTAADLLKIKGFQTTLAQKIVDGIALRRTWIESIVENVTISPSSAAPKTGSLASLNFVITGELSRPRKEIEDEIVSLGGKCGSAVSKNTSYLLTNEINSNSAKFVTAKKLGIKIISESDFEKLVNR